MDNKKEFTKPVIEIVDIDEEEVLDDLFDAVPLEEFAVYATNTFRY